MIYSDSNIPIVDIQQDWFEITRLSGTVIAMDPFDLLGVSENPLEFEEEVPLLESIQRADGTWEQTYRVDYQMESRPTRTFLGETLVRSILSRELTDC